MPSFASQDYWNERFEREKSPFDWLITASALRNLVEEWVENTALSKAEVLHIGCGTSDSTVLRGVVDSPPQIHNVDFAATAVEAGRAHENEVQSREAEDQPLMDVTVENDDTLKQVILPDLMRWSCLDLLSLDSIFSLMEQQSERGSLFDVVLDKSTSDSISCGSDISLDLPYPISINGWTREIMASGVTQSADIHPLHILAVHLAALTTPKTAKWIVISYSEERFPFLPPYPRSASHGFLPESTIQAGFAHPSQLWRLETKEKIDLNANKEETLAERRKRLKEGPVHRPQTSHWLYVLVRTDVVVTD